MLENFEANLEFASSQRPNLIVVTGDFNARCSNWWKNDRGSTSGSKTDCITTSYGLSQIRNKPTHILPNSSSCIDLIFTSDLNMLRESGVHSSLHPNCHHQIVFTKFNLKIYYPPPYERLAWQYQKTNSNLN